MTSPALSVDVCIAKDGWRDACPYVTALCRDTAIATLSAAAPLADRPLFLDIVLTDDAEQRQLNRTYRGKDAPTNVLAFPTGDQPPRDAPLLLGDVVLALETVMREAAEQGKPLADHLRHLIVHGVLHLLGFDHQNDAGADVMEGREREILHKLGVPDPYCDTM